MKHVNITIRGKVQGVWFRKFTKDRADKLHIKGFVKNLDDGGVFISAHGEDPNMDAFIAWCRSGPILAKVTDILIENTDAVQMENFTIK